MNKHVKATGITIVVLGIIGLIVGSMLGMLYIFKNYFDILEPFLVGFFAVTVILIVYTNVLDVIGK